MTAPRAAGRVCPVFPTRSQPQPSDARQHPTSGTFLIRCWLLFGKLRLLRSNRPGVTCKLNQPARQHRSATHRLGRCPCQMRHLLNRDQARNRRMDTFLNEAVHLTSRQPRELLRPAKSAAHRTLGSALKRRARSWPQMQLRDHPKRIGDLPWKSQHVVTARL